MGFHQSKTRKADIPKSGLCNLRPARTFVAARQALNKFDLENAKSKIGTINSPKILIFQQTAESDSFDQSDLFSTVDDLALFGVAQA